MTDSRDSTSHGAPIAPLGREPTSGLYFEVLGTTTQYPHPILFIHGGGAEGSGWRRSMEGGLGWAELLASDGFECWVTDWPNSGRSAARDVATFEYKDIVDGYIALLRDIIRRPVVVVPHSMGGAVAWRLVEELPDLVVGVVGIACAYPANIQKPGTLVSDDGTHVVATFADTGIRFDIDRNKAYFYSRDYIEKQAGTDGPHVPDHVREEMLRFPGSMAPRLLMQRIGVLEGMPIINKTSSFRGKKIRLVAGDYDMAHTLEIEGRTAELLGSWGADARVIWLPHYGLLGHSHWLYMERGYEKVLEVVKEQFHDLREENI